MAGGRERVGMTGLYMVVCSGYPNIYVTALNFDGARQKWLDDYINKDDLTGKPVPKEEKINPMPDTIAFLAPMEEVFC
jgi:hypothetical protein